MNTVFPCSSVAAILCLFRAGDDMKFWAMACLAVVMGGGVQQSAGSVAVQGTWRADYDNYWTRNSSERWISIQLRRDDGNGTNGMGVPERDVPALTDSRSSGPIHFTLRRDAGAFEFDGQVANGRANGDFRFTAD